MRYAEGAGLVINSAEYRAGYAAATARCKTDLDAATFALERIKAILDSYDQYGAAGGGTWLSVSIRHALDGNLL